MGFIAAVINASAADTVPRRRLTDAQFVEGVLRARSYMWFTAAAIVGKEYAEDVVSEAILNAWRGRHTWSGRAQLHTWLVTVAHNTALTHMRALASRPKRTGDPVAEQYFLDSLPAELSDPEMAFHDAQVQRAIESSLGSFQPAVETALRRWMAGLPCEGAGAKSRTFRAMPILVGKVRRQLGLANDVHA